MIVFNPYHNVAMQVDTTKVDTCHKIYIFVNAMWMTKTRTNLNQHMAINVVHNLMSIIMHIIDMFVVCVSR